MVVLVGAGTAKMETICLERPTVRHVCAAQRVFHDVFTRSPS